MTQGCYDPADFYFCWYFLNTNSSGSSTQIGRKKTDLPLPSFVRMFPSLFYRGEPHLDSWIFYVSIIIHYLFPHRSQAIFNFVLVHESNLLGFVVEYFINNCGVGPHRFDFLWWYHMKITTFFVASHKMFEIVLEWSLLSHSSPPPS